MKTGSDADALTLPLALAKEVKAAAQEERRPAEDVLRDAVERYLSERRWQNLRLWRAAGTRVGSQ